MVRTLPLLPFLLVLLLIVPPASAAEDAVAQQGTYRIGAGDVLEISVWKNEQLSRTVTVRPDGMISLPLVNDIQATGLAPIELRDALVKALADYVPSAEVSVIVKSVRSFSISVIGSVAKPGHFDLKGPTTVLEALALSGGLTEFASRRSISVIRSEQNGSKKKLRFNYNKAISADDEGENFLLQPGDVVVVP
jgi:polysaccharide export outer membrane protein